MLYIIRHVAVAHGCHGDHCPPERVRYGLEEGVLGARLGEVDGAREQHDTCKRRGGGVSLVSLRTVPHVPVANGGHRNHGPPEGVRYRFEEGLLGTGLREVHGG